MYTNVTQEMARFRIDDLRRDAATARLGRASKSRSRRENVLHLAVRHTILRSKAA